LELFENYIVPESIGDGTQNIIDKRVSQLIKDCLGSAVKLVRISDDEFFKFIFM